MSCQSYAGELIDRISIEQYTTGKSAGGFPTMTWAEKIEVAAKVEWIRGDEADTLTKETAETRVNFTVSYRNDLDTKQRINFESNYYDILALLDLDNKSQYMKILTKLHE